MIREEGPYRLADVVEALALAEAGNAPPGIFERMAEDFMAQLAVPDCGCFGRPCEHHPAVAR